MRRRGRIRWVAGGAVAAAAAAVAASSAAYPINYCQVIPTVNVPREGWGYHAGAPITGATGSYSRGHGTINLSTGATTGVICQVDRVRHHPDRQIVLAVARHAISHSHYAYMFGYEGNSETLAVKVQRSTDPKCKVGTRGRVTIFASYNGVRDDSVQFFFPAACRDHRHHYTGPSVNANVPPN
jgi:hypothetical protein